MKGRLFTFRMSSSMRARLVTEQSRARRPGKTPPALGKLVRKAVWSWLRSKEALMLSGILLLFDPSPSSGVVGYEVEAYLRSIITVPCPPGQAGPCQGTSPPIRLEPTITPAPAWENAVFAVWAMEPAPGQVVYACVRAVKSPIRKSTCEGDSAWQTAGGPGPSGQGPVQQADPNGPS